jgi:hypothetical protein
VLTGWRDRLRADPELRAAPASVFDVPSPRSQGQRASGIEQVIGDGDEPEKSLQFVKH